MMEWWNTLTLTGRIFGLIAIPATLIMIIQSLMLLFGMGFGGDVDAVDGDAGSSDDVDSDGLSLFTVRGLVAFFSVGGWTGLVLVTNGSNIVVASALAFITGSLALVGIAYMFKFSFKLQDNGNLNINNSLGKSGKIYIPILKTRQSTGKITILIQDKLVELDALTDEDRDLKTGEAIIVTDVMDNQTVIVKSSMQFNNIDSKNINEKRGISKWIQ